MLRTLIHAAVEDGGLGIPSIYTIQGILHTTEILYRLRKQDNIEKLIYNLLHYVQMECGTSDPVWSTNFLASDYASPNWVTNTWEFLIDHNIHFKIPQLPQYEIQRQKDMILMDHIIPHYLPHELKMINS